MKGYVVLLLSFLTAFALNAESKGKCGDNLRWILSDDGQLTITGQGAMKDYSAGAVPWNSTLVRHVSLEEGITHIGANAFCNTKIYTADLPVTVVSIGKRAFSCCKNLSTVQLPYGLTSIGMEAFKDCKVLVKIDLPASLKRIEKKAFSNCKQIASLSLSNRIEIIGEKAFEGCQSLNFFYSLPDIITTNNCHLYGLKTSTVSEYYESVKSLAADKTGTASRKKNGPVIPPAPGGAVKKNTIASAVAYGESDIDRSIPTRPQNNDRTFVFIFANENYNSFPDVPFALNDGKSFHAYCTQALGIPEENITTRFNATLGTMLQTVDYMKQIDASFRGDLSIIVYYAGHGAPDEKTSKAYLIPCDAYTLNEKACYPLEDFYNELSSLNAYSVKVFMDACFSGTGRTEDMLAKGGRSVKAVPKKAGVSGNVVVISATSGDQTAWHYQQQGHGLFTYCLLKKLQQMGGELSMGELCEYLETEVPKLSIVANKIMQTPTSQQSPSLGNRWKLWQVKN